MARMEAKEQHAVVLGIKPWKRWQIAPFLRQTYGRIDYTVTAAGAWRRMRPGADLVVWAAREPAGLEAEARSRGVRLLRMEDGFIRSVGLGSNHVGSSSLVVDADGIYFDPRRPSALEILLSGKCFSADEAQRASALRQRMVALGLSKYNVGSRAPVAVGGGGRQRLLVPGQVENDASLRLGAAGVGGNLGLLRRVREAHPEAWIVFKPHPDTEAGTRPGAVSDAQALAYADQVVRRVSPAALLSHVDAVHTMTSLLGFEALLRGVPVVTWGQPFYAGWGLTQDRDPPPRRGRRLSLDELVCGVLIDYPRYVHPRTQQPCLVEDVVEALSEQSPADPATQRSLLRRGFRLGRGLVRALR